MTTNFLGRVIGRVEEAGCAAHAAQRATDADACQLRTPQPATAETRHNILLSCLIRGINIVAFTASVPGEKQHACLLCEAVFESCCGQSPQACLASICVTEQRGFRGGRSRQ